MARKGEASRARILEEAHAQILSGGIASLSHERIARAAGLSKSAVYWHFPTKKALLEALVAEYVAHLRSEEARFEAPYLAMGFTDGEAILPGMRDWYRSFAQNRRGWIGIGAEILSLGRTERTLTEPVRAWYREIYERLGRTGLDELKAQAAMMAFDGFFNAAKLSVSVFDAKRAGRVQNQILREVFADRPDLLKKIQFD